MSIISISISRIFIVGNCGYTTCEFDESDVVKQEETATYRCDDNRGCVKQFWPPDDEHMRSKHVEAWTNLIVKQKKKICIMLVNYWDNYTEIHGQQNVKKCWEFSVWKKISCL